MKRYVFLIFIILGALILVNFYGNRVSERRTNELSAKMDSLKNVIYFYESRQAQFERSVDMLAKTNLDSLNITFKANDSAIFSHGQQVRWLQWHVERLNESIDKINTKNHARKNRANRGKKESG